MSRVLHDELEERRVIRLLAGAAEAITPLDEVEVADTLGRVADARATVRSARRRPLLQQPLSIAAVAAAVALAALLPMRQQQPERKASSPPAAFQAQLVAFPEGSALSLLLSRPGERRA